MQHGGGAVAVLLVAALLTATSNSARKKDDATIEDVNSKQLESLVEQNEYVAVLWYGRKCQMDCDAVLRELENIDDDTDGFGVHFVKINDKKFAKKYGISEFPALTYFRNQEPMKYEGDLMDEEAVLDFLTSLDAMEMSDQIEEVNAKILDKIVREQPYVAVLFCASPVACITATYKSTCRRCERVLKELENIDDEADQLDIAFVKINDEQLADDYSLDHLPVLVYYRHRIPIVYEGDLAKEESVLEWLIVHKSSGEDDDEIEKVSAAMLEAMIDSVEYLAVVFYQSDDSESEQILRQLENIDDDCDNKGIHFVKCSDPVSARTYGIETLPTLVYFENQIPNIYDGDLEDEDEVFEWLLHHYENDEIEDVTAAMLEKLVQEEHHVAVLFYDDSERSSMQVLSELETIDDECDKENVKFVKIDDSSAAELYGIDTIPTLVYFETSIPHIYDGDLLNEDEVLTWLLSQVENDIIEDISDEMLDTLIDGTGHLVALFSDHDDVAVLFYDKRQKQSQKVLDELENIDDECDDHGIVFVKISNTQEAEEYGIETLPTLVYFENEIPSVYDGDLTKEEEVLEWLVRQVTSDEIEDVTDEMLDKLIERSSYVAALFYDRDDRMSQHALAELENIDDECDKMGIVFVKIYNIQETEEYGISQLPALVYFERQIPSVYEGDLTDENHVLMWLAEQKESETIEEVNDLILEKLIQQHPYVAVYFSGPCSEGEQCHRWLGELENIDDDTDTYGMVFVTTEHQNLAKSRANVKKFPAVVLFRNTRPLIYPGKIADEDAVLKWLTDEKTLLIDDKIEHVNTKMLDKLIANNDGDVVVFFYNNLDKKSSEILTELERIDDESGRANIEFLKCPDKMAAKKYRVKQPSIVYFKDNEQIQYKGDLMDEDKLLDWLMETRSVAAEDVIEEVDSASLQKLIEERDDVVVFFYEKGCKNCDKILAELENIDDELDQADISFLKTTDLKVAKDLSIHVFPTVIFFEKALPIVYNGALRNEEDLLRWIIKHKEDASLPAMSAGSRAKCFSMSMHDDGLSYHCCPAEVKAKRRGARAGKPGDLQLSGDVMRWSVAVKSDQSICEVNRTELQTLIDSTDYLAVLFYGSNAQSSAALKYMEMIDDEADEYGIKCVKLDDKIIAKMHGFRETPGLAYFRRGKITRYSGDLFDEEEIIDWLTDPDNMELSDNIEKVNRKMFERLRQQPGHSFAAVFYSDDVGRCRLCDTVLRRLENIDDDAAAVGIDFVKLDDQQLARQVGVFAVPAVVFFSDNNEPVIYAGDVNSEERLLDWLLSQKDPNSDVIEEMTGPQLLTQINQQHAIAVYFYGINGVLSADNTSCADCLAVLNELENIDDDTYKHGIKLVKTQDTETATTFGVTELPALIYFENQTPSLFEGDLRAEEDVLQWLILQKSEDRIETVNKRVLEHMIQHSQYLAVLFYKPNCKACETAISELESIDDECDLYGINMVKIHDQTMAKRYGLRTLPCLVYFRNGNPLIFEGDASYSAGVLEWLTDDENRELAGEIEEVNERMLERLLDESPFVAVFFANDNSDSGCSECHNILNQLENIDDDADAYGIDFVKISDDSVAVKYGIMHTPCLAYFRKRVPIVYEGDLSDDEKVLRWLTSRDVLELRGEIEEVNRQMLDKLLDEKEFVAVYFYEPNCERCEDVLTELETIDTQTDSLDITFVKIRDARYAKKFGIASLPTMAYFRRRFPSIYRGDLYNEQEVLAWLQKNRYRQPELNVFVYSLAAVTVAFVLYTTFLVFCFHGDSRHKITST